MSGINTGILTKAYPLTTDRIKELEQQVLEDKRSFAYLDQNSDLCFALPCGVNVISDLAWDHAYELTTENNMLIKKAYKKDSLQSYHLSETFTKNTYVDAWQSIGVLEGDGAIYYTLAPTSLSFRSEAPLSELTEIQIDGEILESPNYTLTEGSTIATLPISYLQTLSPGQHTVKIVSKSMSPEGKFDITQPELNEYGFYWNQPYVGYNDNACQDIMFMLKEDGTFEGLVMWDGYPDSGSYTIDGNNITLENGSFIYSLTVSPSNSGKTFSAANGETFNLDEAFVSDGEFMYIYDDYYKGYRVRAFDKDKASYGQIKTGIYDKPTVSIYQDAFNGNSNLIEFTIPEGIVEIEGDVFQSCESLKKVVIPKSIRYIRYQAFCGCSSLNTIIFNGTVSEWNNVSIDEPDIFDGVPATEVQCSDGNVTLVKQIH